jgi:hypothetical protein
LRQSENFNQYRKIAVAYDIIYSVAATAEKAAGLFSKSKAEKALKEEATTSWR